METLNDICSLVRKEDVTLFVGSGCSVPVAPSASTLSKKFYEKLNDSMREGVDENNLQETSSRLMLQEGNSLKRDEIINQAKDEARRRMENLKIELEQEKDSMEKEIRQQIVDIAFAAAEKIVSKEINQDKYLEVVDDILKGANE